MSQLSDTTALDIEMKMKHKIEKTKVVPTYHVVQELLNAKSKRKECARKAALLKYSVAPDVLSQSLDKLFRTTPHYKELLWGNLFPKNINTLGEGNSHFFKSESIIGDFNWLYFQISKNYKAIAKYVEYRDKIEKSILMGYYDEALYLLDEIKRQNGVSIWYYETKLLINSYSDKENKSLELLTEINKAKKDSKYGFVTFLLSYLYKRSSKTYSAYAYDAELENKFSLSRTRFQQYRNNYYLLRLNFFKTYQKHDLTSALIMEATNSLIDRYNLFLNVIKAYYAIEKNELIRGMLSTIAFKFYKKTSDRQLSGIVAHKNIKKVNHSYYNNDYIGVLDSYYQGEYIDCCDRCKRFINSSIVYFDILKIYCRCLIALKKTYLPICTNIDSIANQIAKHLYEAMTNSENVKALNSLYQISKNLYGLNIANGLCYYLTEKKNESDDYLKYLSLDCFDPMYCYLYNSNSEKSNYLEAGLEQLGNHKVITYQSSRNSEDVAKAEGIVKHIIDIDGAKISFKNEDYVTALSLWQTVLQENSTILPIVQCAIDYIFKCYIKLNRKQDAITFFVDNYLKGKAFVNQISAEDFVDTLYKEKYRKGVKNSLDLQLFVFLNASEDEKKSALLERYCSYKDVEKVSDLITELEDELKKDPEKVELYLYILASEDILRHMLYITSTKYMLEEQQKIAQFLTTLKTSPHIKEYFNLNQEILDSMIVYQNIRKIDESKIYVNQHALLKYEFAEYEGLYNQFSIQLENSGSMNTLYIVNTNYENTDNSSQDESIIHAKVKFTNKAFIDSACQVFTVIRDKFLFSKFGLKTYLSTRIRHGVFEGVLRSGYDELHLLLTTVNNKYKPITFWKNRYGLKDSEQNELMRILEKFSRGVNFAIDKFKEESLQIKTNDDEKGMFDFRLTPDDMCYATVFAKTKAKDYNQFCFLLMEYMLQMANGSLINIRKEINETLKSTFTTLVETLSQDIMCFSDRHFFNDLNNAVNSARTDAVKKMAHVEKWFYLQDAKFEDFSLVKQMEAVWQITSKMFPNIDVEMRVSPLDKEIIIKSEYVIHISDMLTIFYNNMFCYSKIEPHRYFETILEQPEDGKVTISFINDISESEENLNNKFKEMLNMDSRLQMEGKSGLVKVKKIIKAELGCEENRLEINAENGKCIARVIINIKDICV